MPETLSKSQINDRLKNLRKWARTGTKKIPPFKWVKIKTKDELKIMHNCVIGNYDEELNYYIAYVNDVPFLMNKASDLNTRSYHPYKECLGAPYNLDISEKLTYKLLKQFLKQYKVSTELKEKFNKIKQKFLKTDKFKKDIIGKYIFLKDGWNGGSKLFLIDKDTDIYMDFYLNKPRYIKIGNKAFDIYSKSLDTFKKEIVLTKEEAVKKTKVLRAVQRRKRTEALKEGLKRIENLKQKYEKTIDNCSPIPESEYRKAK